MFAVIFFLHVPYFILYYDNAACKISVAVILITTFQGLAKKI